MLTAQLKSVRETFFELDLPELDTFMLGELLVLSDTLRIVAKAWRVQPDPSQWDKLVHSWSAFSTFVSERFGWELGLVEGHHSTAKPKLHHDLLRDAAQNPDDEDDALFA